MIAALFVRTNGVYFNLAGVDPWDKSRDARKYLGPNPVIAHPPCERWGRYWSGGPSAKVKRELGDDDGCFESALISVRLWGGVLEHPEASKAFAYFGLGKPKRSGGWTWSNQGWICCVEQGHYGHLARKATWLYYCGDNPPELRWGPCSNKMRLDEGFRSAEHRKMARDSGQRPIKRLSKNQNIDTPIPFRDLLISMVTR